MNSMQVRHNFGCILETRMRIMFQYLFAVCVLVCVVFVGAAYSHPTGNEILEDQQLVLAFVVNRHGERTPDADELSLSNEQEKIKNLTVIEGLEGLTNVGKRRAYQTGKFLRQRYGSQGHDLLSNLYLQDEIAIRSTDKERTKMTVQVAMAALYPPESEQQWDEAVGKVWQPVPYTAVPLSEDYLRYYSNCAGFKALMKKAKEEAVQSEFRQFDDMLPKLMLMTGRNFSEDPLLFETLFDLMRSQVGLGLDIPEWAKPLLPRLSQSATLAYRLYFRTDEMKKIGGGVLLNQFIEAAEAIAANKPVTKRVRLFSAHDFNIGALMEVARVKSDQSIPEYGAVFALELYKSRRTGELSVMPVYLPQAGESPALPLHIFGCDADEYCSFELFKNMTKGFRLTESEFYKFCGIKTEL